MNGLFAGIDIGGTKCAVSVGMSDGDQVTILDKRRFPTPSTPDAAIDALIAALRDLLTTQPEPLASIGISCGGPLDSARGLVLSPPNLPGWDAIPIVERFRDAFGVPTALQNDANAGALAEWLWGAGKGCRNLIFLTFGTGMGAGLILNGQLYSGTNDMAGEVGHVRLADDGPVGYGEDWRWRDAHKPHTRDTRFWRKSAVPGSIPNDLWACGEISNPYFELNSRLIEWIPARTWIYKRTFAVSDDLRGKRIHLRFEGVDYEAEFFLNGEALGHHTGMYTPVQFAVSDKLIYGGDNLVAVVIEPAPKEQPQVGRTSKVLTPKSRMTYRWNFCPRMVHLGIWDAVYLEATGNVRITDVFVRPQLADDFRRAHINTRIELDALQAQTVHIETTIRLNGEIITQQQHQHSLGAGQTTIHSALWIEEPRLW